MKTAVGALLLLSALIFCAGLALSLGGQADPALAAVESAGTGTTSLEVQPGNYCVSCHLPEDPRLAEPVAWMGGSEHAQSSPCPAVLRIQEERLYTEQLLLAVDRFRAKAPEVAGMERIDAQIQAGREGYSRLLDTPVESLSAFTAEAQTLRYQIGKTYAALNAVEQQNKKVRLLIGAIVVTLVICAAFVMGLRITRPAALQWASAGWRRPLKGYLAPVALVLAVFAFFSLPIFRVPAAVTETPSLEEQEVQTTLDEAGRAAETANRASSRAWMIARVGASRYASDPEAAESALGEALVAAREASLNTSALWGRAQAAQELSAGSAINVQKASLTAAELEAERGRAWNLALIAREWMPVDEQMLAAGLILEEFALQQKPQAEAILEEAEKAAEAALGIYRDLDLRLIAAYWARLDTRKALDTVKRVQDPALRSWGLREIAAISGEESIFEEAAEAARQARDPLAKARALRALGEATGEEDYFSEAYEALQEAPQGAARAYELAALAAASENVELLKGIEVEHPEAAALGYYRLGELQQAWRLAEAIPNPYDRGQAQAAIAVAAGSPEMAKSIETALYRDRALYGLSLQAKDAKLAEELSLPYYRVKALTASGDLEAAWAEAGALQEPYPLLDLALAWAKSNPERALEVVEAMEREADKANALRAIAVATKDEELFERALGMALAARVRGDALYPAWASLKLAEELAPLNQEWAQAAYEQALEIALKISVK